MSLVVVLVTEPEVLIALLIVLSVMTFSEGELVTVLTLLLVELLVGLLCVLELALGILFVPVLPDALVVLRIVLIVVLCRMLVAVELPEMLSLSLELLELVGMICF